MKKAIIYILLNFVFVIAASAQNFNGGSNDGHTTANQAGIDASALQEIGSITNVTASNTNGNYGIADIISIKITFDRVVSVSGGTPQITLETGTTDQLAIFSSGNLSETLIFTYTVQEGDNSSDLSYSSTSITRGSATIIDMNGYIVNLNLPISGNPGSLSANKDILIDGIKPIGTIDLAAGQSDPTNNATINYSLNFTEPISGLIIDDFSLSGTAGANAITVSGTGASYNIAVSGMTADGSVILGLAQGRVNDIAGNPNGETVLTYNTINYDGTRPSMEITQASGQTDPTNASPINFTAIFNEAVTGFDNTDVSLSGTANPTTVVVTGSGTSYNIEISGMNNDGTVIIDILANICTDASGNLNTPSVNTDNTVNYDGTRPTVEITQASGQNDLTNTSPINFTATFSEAVTGFDNTDVNLSGTANPTTVVVTGIGTSYNIAVSGMTAEGTVIVDIPADICTDVAGNLNTTAVNTDNTVSYDTSRPSVEITQASGQADPTNTSPINFTAAFSEAVTGFDATDISFSGTASPASVTLTGSGASYNIAVSGMTTDGTVIIDIAENVCADAAGNPNTASVNTDNTVNYDGTRPSVEITSTESGSTELTDIPITVEFSETIQDFSASDIDLTNTNIVNLSEVIAGKKWTAILNPINQGIVEVSIDADIATDNAGNGNTASNVFSISYTIANHAPVIQNQQFSINENSNAGSLIGTVIATDEDNDDLDFEIISGNTDDAFSIDMNTGEISLTASNIIDYEKQAEYQLTIQITDDAPDPLSAQAIITVKILDVEEPFVANNIITPNDARNKYWIIEDVHNFADFKLTIRTATGQIVYETVNYQNDWAGTYNNKDLPTGTYYYTLVSTINKKSYSGFISLIRN